MFALLRLMVPLLVLLTLVYVFVSLWSRRVRRDRLIGHWQARGGRGSRDRFVQLGLARYDRSFRRKLILLVYIGPLALIGLLVYVVNFR